MPAHASEAFVLQTWPFREGDLIVSFLTRDGGKMRGVARRARRPKSGFGSGLERLSHTRMSYFQRENRELVNIDSCELITSQFALAGNYSASCALDFMAEVAEQLLPAAEPSEKFFRLLTATLEHLRTASLTKDANVWRGVTYFSYWAVRLAGLLPELDTCIGCGEFPDRAFYLRGRFGFYCESCRHALNLRGAWELTPQSRAIADEILRTPIAKMADTLWTQATAADLRRFLAQQIEAHIERRLITVPVLEAA